MKSAPNPSAASDICPWNMKCEGFVPLTTPSWGNSIHCVYITSSLKWLQFPETRTQFHPPTPSSLLRGLGLLPAKRAAFLSTFPFYTVFSFRLPCVYFCVCSWVSTHKGNTFGVQWTTGMKSTWQGPDCCHVVTMVMSGPHGSPGGSLGLSSWPFVARKGLHYTNQGPQIWKSSSTLQMYTLSVLTNSCLSWVCSHPSGIKQVVPSKIIQIHFGKYSNHTNIWHLVFLSHIKNIVSFLG